MAVKLSGKRAAGRSVGVDEGHAGVYRYGIADVVDPHWFLPWAGIVAVFAAAAGAHIWWGTGDAVVWAVMSITAVTHGLTGLTWKIVHSRGWVGRVHLAANVWLTGMWLAVATHTGPWTRPVLDMLLIGGPTLAIAWNLRHGMRSADDQDAEDPLGRAWKGGLADSVGLAGSTLRTKEITGPRATARLQLEPGQQTIDDVTRRLPNIASGLKTSPTGIRATRDPDDASAVDLAIVRHDVLRRSTPHPGPEATGRSIADGPVRVGIYEDAAPACIPLYNGLHVLIAGMPGAGKSMGAQGMMIELFARSDVVFWAIDTVKGSQTLGDAEAGIDWFAKTKSQAEAMFEALLRVIKARGDYLGDLDPPLDKWEPGCGLGYLVVLIEEAPAVVREADTYIDVVARARSTGISIITSLQKPSFRNIPTDARDFKATGWCFGVKDSRTADWVLGDDVVERGADPTGWQAKKPGYSYAVGPGIDDDHEVMPMRTFEVQPGQLAAAAAYRAANWVPLDEVSVAAAGKAYQTRRLQLVPADNNKHGQEDADGDDLDVDDVTLRLPATLSPTCPTTSTNAPGTSSTSSWTSPPRRPAPRPHRRPPGRTWTGCCAPGRSTAASRSRPATCTTPPPRSTARAPGCAASSPAAWTRARSSSPSGACTACARPCSHDRAVTAVTAVTAGCFTAQPRAWAGNSRNNRHL